MIRNILTHKYPWKFNWACLMLLSIFNHCYGQKSSITEKLRINPYAAMGGYVSQYIDKLEFITFENTSQSAFGNIDQLEVTDKYYVILDNTDTQSIFIFNKQGEFHSKIDAKVINPQSPTIYSFSFDKQTKLIKVNFYTSLYYFDLDGKEVKHSKNTLDQYVGVEANLGEGFSGHYKYWPQQPHPRRDTISYEVMVTENGKLKQKYLPYRTNLKYDGSRGTQSHEDFWPASTNSDSATYYTRDYDYDIYRLTPHTFDAAYRLIFPIQLSLPSSFREDTVFDGKRAKFLKENQEVVFKIANFYKQNNSVFFRTITNGQLRLSYLYNTQSLSLICINKIVSDSSSYFLPITDAEVGGADFINRGLVHFDGDSFYCSYSSLVFFHQMEATKNKHPHYPPALLKYFREKRNLKGNPVLVQLKFKPQL